MYLSQLILDPRARRVQREIGNPYELHRTLMNAFPNKVEGGPGRVLYRLEPAGRAGNGELVLLVQSDKAPDWDQLDEPQGYRLPDGVTNPKVFNPTFLADRQLRFRLRANPTVKRAGKRQGLYRDEEQLDWLRRKAEENGFRVLNVNLTGEGKQAGVIRHPDEKPRPLTHLAVRFDGLLQVTDPAAFLKALRGGIGSGKGFGFGLLSLAPA
jgi:CRISPR system Cascade subunit CasE